MESGDKGEGREAMGRRRRRRDDLPPPPMISIFLPQKISSIENTASKKKFTRKSLLEYKFLKIGTILTYEKRHLAQPDGTFR